MNKNIRKYLEYLFFGIINIGLLLPVYFLLLFFVRPISLKIVIKIFKVDSSIVKLDDPTAIIIGIFFCLGLFFLKPFIINILYLFKNLFPYICGFLNKIQSCSKYIILILGVTFFIDIFSGLTLQHIIIINEGIIINLIPISLIYGLFSNYSVFFLLSSKNNLKIFILLKIIFIILFLLFVLFYLFTNFFPIFMMLII